MTTTEIRQKFFEITQAALSNIIDAKDNKLALDSIIKVLELDALIAQLETEFNILKYKSTASKSCISDTIEIKNKKYQLIKITTDQFTTDKESEDTYLNKLIVVGYNHYTYQANKIEDDFYAFKRIRE